MSLLTERYADRISGVLSCYDRMIIQGTLPGLCFPKGMTSYLHAQKIRIFDYAKWAEPLREQLRANAETLAAEHQVKIEFMRSHHTRKEAVIEKVLQQRGSTPGLVHILSAMESCAAYKPWYDKASGQCYLKPDQGKCLHYYFYFIDEELGLCYLRVPTWAPFRLQFYCNGHNWLAAQLRRNKVDYTLRDNAFTQVADWAAAQTLSDQLDPKQLHERLEQFAATYCPVITELNASYHWSLVQVEYATDIVFKQRQDLAAFYEPLLRTALQAVKPENVATFLGRKLDPRYADVVDGHLEKRLAGTRLKHRMGASTIKVYDKFGLILRVETTTNDVSFFKHYREVEHRDHSRNLKWTAMKKTIYSLAPLRTVMSGANRRYLEFLSALDDTSTGAKRLRHVTETVVEDERSYKGLNFFAAPDQHLLSVLARGEFNLSGFRNKDLRSHLSDQSSGQVSRVLKRLRVHGLVKKVGTTYRYYLTKLGKQVVTAGLTLKEQFLIPKLAVASQA